MNDFLTTSWVVSGILILGTAFGLTYIATPIFERLAPYLRLMDIPDARHAHTRPTPRAGGIAVFLGFHVACAFFFLYLDRPSGGDLDTSWWLRFLAVSSVLLVVGLTDDAFCLRPLLKLAGQTAAALLAYAMDLRFGSVLGVSLPVVADLIMTLVWFLVFINVFNLIDGMDGLATGLGLIASLGVILSLAIRGQAKDILPILALSGACLAFLRYNFHPARIFLGDSGSMFLGLALAAIALRTASKSALLPSLLVPFLAVGVPLFDTLLAVWRRSIRQSGRVFALFEGDTDHLHHRLARAGLTQRQVAGLLYLFSGALILVGLLLMTLRSYVIGISLTAFVAGVYVIIRHLAHVELWDTGTAILRGLQRPPKMAVAVLAYPLADVLIMAVALTVAMRLVSSGPLPSGFVARLIHYSVIWVGIPFLALIVAGTYRRVWSRAGTADFAIFLTSLSGGLLLAGGAANLLLGFAPRSVLAYLTLYGSLTLAALMGLRCIRPMVLDILAYLKPRRASGKKSRHLLLYGAGDRAIMFMREQGCTSIENPDHERIVGILAEDSNLHGRLIHGYRVLGGMDWLQHESDNTAFDELIIVENLTPEYRARLLDVAKQRNIEVSEWRTERRRYC